MFERTIVCVRLVSIAFAVGVYLVVCRTSFGAKVERPMLKPIVISAHRAGGRVYAPDNSEPNIEHAVALGLNMIEIDLRPTKDGALALHHDPWFPRSYLFPDDTSKTRMQIYRLTLAEIRKARYSETVGGRKWADLKIPDADSVIERYKDKLNFHLDVKNTSAERVLKLIADHHIEDRVIVMCPKLDLLRAIKKANPKIVVEWTQNTLGRYRTGGKWVQYPMERQLEEYRKALSALREIGGEMLCVKLLTPRKVRLCHEYGVAVRPSVGHIKATNGERYIRMGCDGILCNNPEAVVEAVKRILGSDYVPKQGMTLWEIFGEKQR